MHICVEHYEQTTLQVRGISFLIVTLLKFLLVFNFLFLLGSVEFPCALHLFIIIVSSSISFKVQQYLPKDSDLNFFCKMLLLKYAHNIFPFEEILLRCLL